MALIDDVKKICDRLAPSGWRDLLLDVSHGVLDISQANATALKNALAKPLPQIKRSHPGFEDFSRDGAQGITPGLPAQSLLYHAFHSPNVLTGPTGNALVRFPTLRDLETIENYVFGVNPPTVQDLLQKTGAQKLEVVVFSYEYRPAKDTCARLQADVAYSRTGISRVGTADMQYRPERRGFWAGVEADPFAIRVCPARFGAFLAVKQKGNAAKPLPMRFMTGDASLHFWVPVHKLFNGKECIKGLDLKVEFKSFHVNEKLRRIRLAFGKNPPNAAPYIFSTGIAEFVSGGTLCEGLLAPVVHERLVEPAVEADGKFATFKVPVNTDTFGAFEPRGLPTNLQGTPEYLHARTEVKNGTLIDLNNDPSRPDVLKTVQKGGYDALLYVDFTGDGQIDATVTGAEQEGRISTARHPAYSLVGAPDFFASTGQRELTEWTVSNEVPQSVQSQVWARPPIPLSDVRRPANLQLKNNTFDRTEKTVTAVVSLFGPPPTTLNQVRSRDVERHSCLPDDAAGLFAPGWDVSRDTLNQTEHLAAYPLGSPFPEDSKLCAALSTFWPSVAPDISRGMEPNPNTTLRATVAPLTDEEIGQVGSLPWDGNPGPKVITINNQQFVDVASFFHVDYVKTALDNRFTLRLLSRITAEEYQRRVLTMVLANKVLGSNPDGWFLLSYLRVSPGDQELQQAQIESSKTLPGAVYRCDFFQITSVQPSPANFQRRLMPLFNRNFMFIDPKNRLVLRRPANQALWTNVPVVLS